MMDRASELDPQRNTPRAAATAVPWSGMRWSCLLPLLALPWLPRADEIAVLDDWVERYERRRTALAPAELERLDLGLIDLRGYSRRSPVHAERAARALLDLCAASLAATEVPDRRDEAWSLRDRAADEWERLPSAGLDWTVREVLVVGAGNPPARRAAAAHLLARRNEPAVVRGLVVAARDDDSRVAAAAAEALVGRADLAVHRAFVTLLESEPTPGQRAAAEAHFRAARPPDDDRLQARLAELAHPLLASDDRRDVAAGAALSGGLRDDLAVPALLEALGRWTAPAAGIAADPRRERARNDLARALERRAGVRLGPSPERWRTWWQAHRDGASAAPAGPTPQDPRAGEDPDRTRSSFFGIRPDSERVVFVLDRSGSMKLPFDEKADPPRSRYEVALGQMARYLAALGPDARFNLVLFEDGFEVWRSRLQPVTSTSTRAAEAWARRRPPEGGTQLRHGLERAFEVEPGGRPAPEGPEGPEGPEADTILVLCDGRTDEGSAWVGPFLRRANPTARVVVHAVQIGAAGDGTLETLARETGGDFIGHETARDERR